MCEGCEVITTGQSPQIRLAGVVEPSENGFRLIADVRFDNDFPLTLGVVGSNFRPLQTPKFLLYPVNLRLCKNHGRLMEIVKS